MKFRRLLLSSLLCFSACATAPPSRVDNISDPRASERYKDFIAHGGIADFPIDASLKFKPGLPRTVGELNSAVTYGAPEFDFLDTFLVVVIHTPPYKIEITGYTDNQECLPEQCQRLSQIRAEAVYQLLVQKGVPVAKLKAPVGYGSSKPITSNATEEDRQIERRVEINMSEQ